MEFVTDAMHRAADVRRYVTHPHQLPEYVDAIGGRYAWALHERAGVIVPFVVDDGAARSPGYGGPMWWGDVREVGDLLQAAARLIAGQGASTMFWRADPTTPPPPLHAVGEVRDIGRTVVVAVSRTTVPLDNVSKSIRRDVRRAAARGYRVSWWPLQHRALDRFVELHVAAHGREPDVAGLLQTGAALIAAVPPGAPSDPRSPGGCRPALGPLAAGQVVSWANGHALEVGPAACHPDHRALSPLKAVDIDTLNFAATAGCRWVHLGGSASCDDCADGAYEYKLRLGGDVRPDLSALTNLEA